MQKGWLSKLLPKKSIEDDIVISDKSEPEAEAYNSEKNMDEDKPNVLDKRKLWNSFMRNVDEKYDKGKLLEEIKNPEKKNVKGWSILKKDGMTDKMEKVKNLSESVVNDKIDFEKYLSDNGWKLEKEECDEKCEKVDYLSKINSVEKELNGVIGNIKQIIEETMLRKKRDRDN